MQCNCWSSKVLKWTYILFWLESLGFQDEHSLEGSTTTYDLNKTLSREQSVGNWNACGPIAALIVEHLFNMSRWILDTVLPCSCATQNACGEIALFKSIPWSKYPWMCKMYMAQRKLIKKPSVPPQEKPTSCFPRTEAYDFLPCRKGTHTQKHTASSHHTVGTWQQAKYSFLVNSSKLFTLYWFICCFAIQCLCNHKRMQRPSVTV